jgi:hypothetical protein
MLSDGSVDYDNESACINDNHLPPPVEVAAKPEDDCFLDN